MQKIISLLTGQGSDSLTDVAYFAGILDGEGSLYLHHRANPIMKGRRGNYTRAYVQVVNTHRGLIDWLVQRWGGSVATTRRPNTLACYSWHLSGRTAAELLRVALPFLIIKRERAELYLAMFELIRTKTTGRGRLLDADNMAARQAIFERYRALSPRTREVA